MACNGRANFLVTSERPDLISFSSGPAHARQKNLAKFTGDLAKIAILWHFFAA
jgi:hypothetical protein